MVIKIKNIFLTGRIQVGKSTLINKILAKFWGAFSGFRTLPYYDEYNQLNGFYLETLPQSLMLKELPFIGRRFEDNRWVGFPSVFEKLGTAILNECLIMKPDLFVMDELGFFESDALQFQGKVLEVLDSPIPVLGVLKQADVPFLNNIRKRDDVMLITVLEENRNYLFEVLTEKIKEMDFKRSGGTASVTHQFQGNN